MTPDTSTLLRMYDIMTTAKQCDERVRGLVMSGQLGIMWYSARGHEAIAAGVGVHLLQTDYLITTYRGLHDEIAKGVPLRRLWAEWLGKATGPCRGKGGPVHVIDPEHGVMVNSGIIGGGLPIAAGLALAAEVRGDRRVTTCSFGDGAVNIGAFHEAMNLAGIWNLPVIFLCQNNGYAETTAFAATTSVDHVADRAAAYRMPGVRVDGNDPLAVYEAAGAAVERARSGGGPTLIEAETYRLFGHYVGDDMAYQPADEMAAARAADPVPAFRQWLLAHGHVSEGDLTGVEAHAAEAIEDAYAFAVGSPDPDPSELLTDVMEVAG